MPHMNILSLGIKKVMANVLKSFSKIKSRSHAKNLWYRRKGVPFYTDTSR